MTEKFEGRQGMPQEKMPKKKSSRFELPDALKEQAGQALDYLKEMKEGGEKISDIMGVELDLKSLNFQEKLSTELNSEEQKIVMPDMLGMFDYKTRKIIILQDRVIEKSNEAERLFKTARFPIQDTEKIQKFVKKYAIVHELVHVAHFIKDPTIFEKQNDNLQSITELTQEIFRNQQELQLIIPQLEKLAKERKIDLGAEIKDLPDDIQQKAEIVKRLSVGITEKNSRLQVINDCFLMNLVFSEAVADVITSKIADEEKMGDAYQILIGKAPKYKNLGILGKIAGKAIESSIKASFQKRGGDPRLLELRLEGIKFIEDVVQEFKGDIKTAVAFVTENPPCSLDEVKHFATYFKRCKSNSKVE